MSLDSIPSNTLTVKSALGTIILPLIFFAASVWVYLQFTICDECPIILIGWPFIPILPGVSLPYVDYIWRGNNPLLYQLYSFSSIKFLIANLLLVGSYMYCLMFFWVWWGKDRCRQILHQKNKYVPVILVLFLLLASGASWRWALSEQSLIIKLILFTLVSLGLIYVLPHKLKISVFLSLLISTILLNGLLVSTLITKQESQNAAAAYCDITTHDSRAVNGTNSDYTYDNLYLSCVQDSLNHVARLAGASDCQYAKPVFPFMEVSDDMDVPCIAKYIMVNKLESDYPLWNNAVAFLASDVSPVPHPDSQCYYNTPYLVDRCHHEYALSKSDSAYCYNLTNKQRQGECITDINKTKVTNNLPKSLSPSTSDWILYNSDELKFLLYYPSDMRLEKRENQIFIKSSEPPDALSRFGISIAIAPEDLSKRLDTANLANLSGLLSLEVGQSKEFTPYTFGMYTRLPDEEIDGTEAHVFESQGRYGGVISTPSPIEGEFFRVYYVRHNQTNYIFSAYVGGNNTPLDLFKQILSTVSFD